MRSTYTGATEVAGPGSVGRVGNGVEAHACSMSALERPAGKCAVDIGGGGVGTSSEQSTRSLSLKPRTVILRKAALNADWSLSWLSVARHGSAPRAARRREGRRGARRTRGGTH